MYQLLHFLVVMPTLPYNLSHCMHGFHHLISSGDKKEAEVASKRTMKKMTEIFMRCILWCTIIFDIYVVCAHVDIEIYVFWTFRA